MSVRVFGQRPLPGGKIGAGLVHLRSALAGSKVRAGLVHIRGALASGKIATYLLRFFFAYELSPYVFYSVCPAKKEYLLRMTV